MKIFKLLSTSKKSFLLLLAATFFGFVSNSNAQIIVTTGITPQDLVQNTLLGSGVTVSNITFSGDANQIGHFLGNNSNIPLDSGVVMGTGDVAMAPGPNDLGSTDLGGGNFGVGDTDLDIIVGPFGTNDAAILEFDFIPIGDTVSFNYIFASEEYPEFVNGGFNDAFGFFISGPGFNGPYQNQAENIALIPGTTTPVTIDDVNNGTANLGPCVNCAYYVANGTGLVGEPQYTDPTVVQYDGLTTVLTAIAAVQCGQTYHIKLAIADAGDTAYDSAVFLEGGSFGSEGVEVDITTVTGDSIVYEGCDSAMFVFTRPDTSGTLTVGFTLGGNAINGTDYDQLPDSIFFPAGSSTSTLVLNPIWDGLAEGIDTVYIFVYTITPCGDTIVDGGGIFIADQPDIQIATNDVLVTCPTDSVQISATATGGIPGHSYTWDNGMTGQTIWVPSLVTDTFIVEVYDTCALVPFYDTVIVEVNLPPAPLVDAGNDTTVNCAGFSITLTGTPSLGTSPYTYLWDTGETTSSIVVTPAVTDTFTVTITDACGITATDTVIVIVAPGPPTVIMSNDTTVACAGDVAFLDVMVNTGTAPFTYLWSTGATTSSITVNPGSTTTYYVEVSDACFPGSVQDSVTVTVSTYAPLQINAGDETPICPGDLVTLTASATGGNPGYTWSWNTGDNDSTTTVSPNVNTTYTVTITDQCGNTTNETVEVTMPNYDTLSVSTGGDGLICDGDLFNLVATAGGGAGGYSYQWFDIDGNPIGNSVSSTSVTPAETDTVYTVVISDQCGNVASNLVQVVFDNCIVAPPNVFTPNGDGINDFWVIDNIEKTQNEVIVYNRWGTIVFETTDYKGDWDGDNLSDGTYYYIVKVVGQDAYTGYVQILRGAE